jgi:hypothetical protein
VNLIYEMKVSERIELPCPGRRSTNIDGSDSSFFAEDDGATGQGLEITCVANLDPQDIGNGMMPFHL